MKVIFDKYDWRLRRNKIQVLGQDSNELVDGEIPEPSEVVSETVLEDKSKFVVEKNDTGITFFKTMIMFWPKKVEPKPKLKHKGDKCIKLEQKVEKGPEKQINRDIRVYCLYKPKSTFYYVKKSKMRTRPK